MVSNVTIEYSNAEKKSAEARTSIEKLAALEEMKRYVPKHKGAENMRAEISGKIAKLKKQIEKEKIISSKKGSAPTMSVKKEGSAQIAIVGLPNTGKSTLLKALTNAEVEIADYEFTTVKPELGMMDYQGAGIQLIELPAIIEGSSEGKAQGTQILSVARNADAIVVCARNNEETKLVKNELEKSGIIVNEEKPKIVIKKSSFKGIKIAGKQHLKIPEAQLITFLDNAGIKNANIIISEDSDLAKFAIVLDHRLVFKKTIVINVFEEKDIEKIKEKIFSSLNRMLVYTKKPGEEADLSKPLLVEKEITAEEIAESVHKDIAKKFKFAKVWGSTKFPGQRVAKDYVLQDRDIIEVNA